MTAGTGNASGLPAAGNWSGGDSNLVFGLTLGLALVVHLLIILGVRFAPPRPDPRVVSTVEVVVLHEAGPATATPDKVSAPAQRTQAGSGQGWRDATRVQAQIDGLPEPVRTGLAALDLALDQPPPEEPPPEPDQVLAPIAAPSPIPAVDPPPQPAEPGARAPAPEDAQALTAPIPEPDGFTMPDRPADRPPAPPPVSAAQILASRSQELARLASRIEDRTSVFGNRPRRTAVSSSTKEYKYATYLEGWRRKVEQIGNLNYPDEARRKHLYGNLILRVGVHADGKVEKIQVLRSSGFKVLDDAAIRIVELAAPFAPFPRDIAAETDILDITRTWQFQRNNQLGWGN